MRVHYNLADASRDSGIRHLAIGFFDGVHLGHQQVIQAGPTAPAERAVLTFWPHPQAVLFPERTPALITAMPHKLRLLEKSGIGAAVILPFDRNMAMRSPEDFFGMLSQGFPSMESCSVGPNFRFGRDRAGDPSLIVRWAGEQGRTFHLPEERLHEGRTISSSRIREHLSRGELVQASAMLGRPYSVWGRIVEGNQLGHTLGFPTANLSTEDHLLLPLGVYAARAVLEDGISIPAAMNIGHRPTVDNQAGQPVYEAHLLDFEGNLYGSTMDLQPVAFLRPEQRFDNLDALKKAVLADIEKVRTLRK